MRRVIGVVVVLASIVALVSFGGQLVAVWVLLPAQWWCSRRTRMPALLVWSTLSSLLVAETLPMLVWLLGGRGWWLGAMALAGAVATVVAYALRARPAAAT